ncbi:MAG: hypothetical protein WCU88_12235 [Elusimicrobiota bacterium]|jgi:negative regulator of sigma E activity
MIFERMQQPALPGRARSSAVCCRGLPAAVLVLFAGAAFCAPAPVQDAQERAAAVLRRTFSPAREAYRADILVLVRRNGRDQEDRVRVRVLPPEGFSREVLDAQGRVRLRAVSDGKVEWVHDLSRKTAYQGAPEDADCKLLDPDEELGLLERNHALNWTASESVAGRRTDVLELRAREDSRLIRKLWVDEAGRVLRRESYGEDGSISSSMRVESLVSLPVGERKFDLSVPAGLRVRARDWRPDFMDLEEAAAASGRKPVLPVWLPSGFVFESVDLVPYKKASILHLRFTDGLDALSLFEYPRGARLRLGLSGQGRVRSLRVGRGRGRLAVVPEGKILVWSAGGNRYVLIGPCSVEAMRRIASSLQGNDRDAIKPQDGVREAAR